jgi:GNAT superfamily N-acetyltransferase
MFGDALNLEIVYRKMKETDIEKVLPIYINYYNGREGGLWTNRTAYKRIHQVWSREDSYCLIFVCNKALIGFAMGYFEQYDDLTAYDLVEIVIACEYQNKGIGADFMRKLEWQVKSMGASLIQLEVVNDKMHNHFYSKLQYKNCNNLILKSKLL